MARFAVAAAFEAALIVASSAFAGDVTKKLENLGIPLSKRYADSAYKGCGCYARNVWALKAFDGRIYIGAGNSANGGPASNAGPVPVFSYDPKARTFSEEWSVPDEQIDIYHEFSDGRLYIPGHDPREDWKLGNFYRRGKGAAGKWEKVRTLPDGVHCYDMEEFDGKLFACGYGVYESADWGKTVSHVRGPRYYAFLKFAKTLYAVASATPKREIHGKMPNGKTYHATAPAHFGVSRRPLGGTNEFLRAVSPESIFPDTPEVAKEELKLIRPAKIGGHLLCIGGIVHNDHQIDPLGAYLAKDGPKCFTTERVKLPEGARPWYTMAFKDKAYLLFSVKDAKNGGYVNHVWVTADGRKFTELLSFHADAFARSMEYFGGYLYFGLGSEVAEHGHFEGNSLKLKFSANELDQASGMILRLKTRL